MTTTDAAPSTVEANESELVRLDADGQPGRRSLLRFPKLSIGEVVTGRGSWRVLRNLAIVAVVAVLFAGSLVDIADFVGLRDTASPECASTQTTTPNSASESVATPSDDDSPPTDAKATDERSYTVIRGDFLYDIARRHGTTPQVLAELNEITNPNRIEVGQVLLFPDTTDD